MEKETPATLHDAARVGDVARLEELLEAGKARGKKSSTSWTTTA